MIALNNLWLGLVKFYMGKAPDNNAKKCIAVTSTYLCISIYLVSGPILFDLVTYLLILQAVQCNDTHIQLSENVKTTCAFPFILMPLTGARWRQRHIFHC